MTRAETNTARKLLADHADRTEVIGADTAGGWAITAYWLDGSGQKLFYTLDEVQRHLDSHRPS